MLVVIRRRNEDTVIPLLREQMPKAIEEKIIDAISLGIDTPEHELLEEIVECVSQADGVLF